MSTRSGTSFGFGLWQAGLSLGALIAAPIAAQAVCTDMSSAQSRPILNAFLVRPVGVLERFPSGGPDLAARLGATLAADVKGILPSMIEIIRSANLSQKEAIGTALGSTQVGCLRFGDSRGAELVQDAIARMTDTIVRSGYYAVTAGITDPDKKPTGIPSPSSSGRPPLPVGRLPNPFAPQTQSDPNKPLPPIR